MEREDSGSSSEPVSVTSQQSVPSDSGLPESPPRRLFPMAFQHLAVRRFIAPQLAFWLCIGAIPGVVTCPAPAIAQVGAPSAAEKIRSIRERMDLGQSLYAAGNWAGAARIFDESFEKYPYSAFLFNAGVCYEKLGQPGAALERFQKYLRVDPNAPDLSMVKERIAALLQQRSEAPDLGKLDGGAAVPGVAEGPADAGAGAGQAPTPSAASHRGSDAMKSLVLVETEPPGAPVELWSPNGPLSGPYLVDQPNPDWHVIAHTEAPANLTMDVGRYHVVVRKFRDYNQTERDIDVTPGKVLHFMANLSQGRFLGFLRVATNVPGAQIFLDDPRKEKPAWGTAPHAELVGPGDHQVLVEAPGHQPILQRVKVEQGEQNELTMTLQRLPWGILRIDATAPEVTVQVDGRVVGVWRSGQQPLEVHLSAGPKELVVSGRKQKGFRGLVNIPKGQVLPVHVKMIPSYPRGPAWTQAVISGVLLGTSTVLGVESNRLHSALARDREAGILTSEDSRALHGKVFAVAADAGFAIGGLVGLLATYNFIKDPLPKSSQDIDEPVEFGAPVRPKPRPAASAKAPTEGPAVSLGFAPGFSTSPGALWLGGRF